jgi:general secretion pathway protein I
LKNNNPAQQGFSLLEILIAFSILGLSLGILLRIFSGGLNTAALAEEYTAAVEIGETMMAKTGAEIPLRNHESSGTVDDKYNWLLRIRPYTLRDGEGELKIPQSELFQINVTVDWGGGNPDEDNRQIQLSTLKLHTTSNAAVQQ